MPIQLDKILAAITEERVVHPYNLNQTTKKEQDEAWSRVSKKNKLAVHEAKSIFKVLQKKYEQEKLKNSSTWKLYHIMDEICQGKGGKIKNETNTTVNSEPEEESFVEYLEVRDEFEDEESEHDQHKDKHSKSTSPAETGEKDTCTTIYNESKPEQKLLNTHMMIQQTAAPIKPDYTSTTTPLQHRLSSAVTSALQRKGISMRKTTPQSIKQTVGGTVPTQLLKNPPTQQKMCPSVDISRTVILPEGLKRKLQNVERREEIAAKKANFSTTASSVSPAQTGSQQTIAQQTSPPPSIISTDVTTVTIKQEVVDDTDTPMNDASLSSSPVNPAINVITIPANSTNSNSDLPNGNITTIKANGFNSTRIEDIDFQRDIIFDNTPATTINCPKQTITTSDEIINIGNFDNNLPPTFFKNLCNSQRHEALGLYVANVMNRVTGKTARKLELNILKAIVEAQSDELARL